MRPAPEAKEHQCHVSETLKMHIFYHYDDYLEKSGESLLATADEVTEAVRFPLLIIQLNLENSVFPSLPGNIISNSHPVIASIPNNEKLAHSFIH